MAQRTGEIDAAKHKADIARLRHFAQLFQAVKGRGRFHVEQEGHVRLLVLGKHLVLGGNEFRERIGRLDHRSDDVIHTILARLDQVADRLATADLERDLQPGAAGQFEQAQEFIAARAFGLKLGLDRDKTIFGRAFGQNRQHAFFVCVHV